MEHCYSAYRPVALINKDDRRVAMRVTISGRAQKSLAVGRPGHAAQNSKLSSGLHAAIRIGR